MESQNLTENSLCASKRVHYAEHLLDTYNENLAEGGEALPPPSEISKSSPLNYSEVGNSDLSISTDILDVDDQDSKSLKKKLEEIECRVQYLENENKVINDEFLAEKKKNSKLEKKLQFVKDNQEVFMRLKEAYINMKYNEAAGRKMIEIRERGIQTWEGTLCSSCIETEELRRQIEIMLQKYKELFVVSPGEMEHLVNTVKYLKDLINRREESWAVNLEREYKLKTNISVLEHENSKLREVITNLQENNSSIPTEVIEEAKLEQKLLEERKIEEMQKFVEIVTKDLEKLKKIIIKYEKNFRELKMEHPGKFISPLNDKEMKIVTQIITKYTAKVHRKALDDLARSRSPSNGSERVPQSRRPSSPLRSLCKGQSSSSPPGSPVIHSRRTPESAILNMDCLFD